MLILIPHRREENLITSRFTTKTRGHGELPRDQVLSVSSVRTTVAVQCRAPRADVPSRRPDALPRADERLSRHGAPRFGKAITAAARRVANE